MFKALQDIWSSQCSGCSSWSTVFQRLRAFTLKHASLYTYAHFHINRALLNHCPERTDNQPVRLVGLVWLVSEDRVTSTYVQSNQSVKCKNVNTGLGAGRSGSKQTLRQNHRGQCRSREHFMLSFSGFSWCHMIRWNHGNRALLLLLLKNVKYYFIIRLTDEQNWDSTDDLELNSYH